MRDLRFFLICAAGSLACVAALGAEERLDVPGLEQPVEIRRDRWGIAHIYAKTERDLFFAQGFQAARDRTFQLELWRRQATGTMAEIRGPAALTGDIGARLLRFRGDMGRELAHYHPRGAEIVGAFVAGINAYIEQTEREPERLPLPFRILGIRPGRWTTEVVVSRHNGLYRNAAQEVQYAQLVRTMGEEPVRDLLNLHPGRPSLRPDERLDMARISAEILKPYAAARATASFRPDDVEPEFRAAPAPPEDPGRKAAAQLFPALENDPDLWGSNNWVVAGSRTLFGQPIVANDPHRAMQVPSLRHWVHLVGPGWDVIGGGEPALPGVAIGHNRHGAWGITIFPTDQEDLFVYETDPADPSRYRYRDDWERMQVRTERFVVKGRDPVEVELKYTRHGPVLHEDRKHNRAYALRAVWLERGTAPYLASLRFDQAANWAEFRDACRYALMPALNMVWADVEGGFGWQATGLLPLRRNWDGLLPVPGDGRYEWDGFVPVPELPHRSNPSEGWFATANQLNLPPGYPHAVGFSWAAPFRHARIAEVLDSGRRLDVADMMALQQDELSIPARLLVPLLKGLDPEDERASEAIERLSGWDFVLARDSVPAAIYAAWERALKEAIGRRFVPEAVRSVLPSRSIPTETLVRWLTTPDGRFEPDPIAARDAVLREALDVALDDLRRRLGPDMDAWRFGQENFKHIRLRHSLSGAVNPAARARLDLGPLPRGGSGTTVNNTSDSDNQTTGASFRVISAVGDWDRTVGTSSPGQSDDPASPHYSDLFRPWSHGRYFPVLYSRPAVESVTESTTHLQPATAGPAPGGGRTDAQDPEPTGPRDEE